MPANNIVSVINRSTKSTGISPGFFPVASSYSVLERCDGTQGDSGGAICDLNIFEMTATVRQKARWIGSTKVVRFDDQKAKKVTGGLVTRSPLKRFTLEAATACGKPSASGFSKFRPRERLLTSNGQQPQSALHSDFYPCPCKTRCDGPGGRGKPLQIAVDSAPGTTEATQQPDTGLTPGRSMCRRNALT
jgi:hypothetical protein